MGIDIAASKVIAKQRHFLWVALGIFTAGIPFAMIFGWLFGRTLAAPIVRLTESIKRIAKGDLSHRVSIKSNDEIGILAKSFNEMTENLQKGTALEYEIVERKKAEEKLQTTVNKLTIANSELGDFAHITAHDLKAPLRVIGSLVSMISQDYGDKLDEQGKEYLRMLVLRTLRMSKFISGILRYSEIGKAASERCKVNLNEVVDEVVYEITPPESIEIIRETTLPTIIADEIQMIQVFQNLIGNAVKYMDKPQGQIRIGCAEEDGFWKFSVADNGPGIDEKYYEKIFKIFQTLNRRDDVESTGIGLSIVKKIVEIYSGKVWVESKPGQGATFFFTLPKSEAAPAEEKELVEQSL